eukprot:49982-Eustigmatos_ZCMA.PRE.1
MDASIQATWGSRQPRWHLLALVLGADCCSGGEVYLMAPDDFIQSLQEIRTEVQVLYAMHCMARVELDLYVQSIFGLIDSQ